VVEEMVALGEVGVREEVVLVLLLVLLLKGEERKVPVGQEETHSPDEAVVFGLEHERQKVGSVAQVEHFVSHPFQIRRC
jgi:hypothetical protein